MPSNSRAVDKALCDYLAADATLRSYLPDGVHMNNAPQERSRFVLIEIIEHEDHAVFGRRAWETVLYFVQTVARKGVLASLYDADARIDTLLEGGRLTVPGYGFGAMYRERRIRDATPADLDKSVEWFTGGGYYRVQVGLPDPVVGTQSGDRGSAINASALSDLMRTP